jgi:hypothetical protein
MNHVKLSITTSKSFRTYDPGTFTPYGSFGKIWFMFFSGNIMSRHFMFSYIVSAKALILKNIYLPSVYCPLAHFSCPLLLPTSLAHFSCPLHLPTYPLAHLAIRQALDFSITIQDRKTVMDKYSNLPVLT